MEPSKKTNKLVVAGWVLTALAVLPFIPSAIFKFMHGKEMVENWTKSGWSESLLTPLGIVEVVCVALYLIPRFSVLGAILLTGYLGGAIATTLRMGQNIAIPAILGVIVWGGLVLRDSRLRELLPIRKPQV